MPSVVQSRQLFDVSDRRTGGAPTVGDETFQATSPIERTWNGVVLTRTELANDPGGGGSWQLAVSSWQCSGRSCQLALDRVDKSDHS